MAPYGGPGGPSQMGMRPGGPAPMGFGPGGLPMGGPPMGGPPLGGPPMGGPPLGGPPMGGPPMGGPPMGGPLLGGPPMRPAMGPAMGPAMQPMPPVAPLSHAPAHWGAGAGAGAGNPLLANAGELGAVPASWARSAQNEGHDGHDGHGHDGHHDMWLVKQIEASPWIFLFGGFGCLAGCFALLGLLLLLGVPILDPRPNDIVPVILREHIAKKRQDAGRSVKEVALACPGCEDLDERSERMFYLHIIYEVEKESGTLWETDILRSIHAVEQRIYEARGPGPDGKEWAFTDVCLLAKPEEQLKSLGRDVPSTPRCAFALSPLLFLADNVLPLADPPPFQLHNVLRTGYLWINESHHAWTDPLTRCAVPPEDTQKEQMGRVTGSWFMKKATNYYDKKLGADPSEELVDSWCTSASGTLPSEMSDCGCLALVYNDVQMALNWDISLQQMWDFEYGFKKLMKAQAQAYVNRVLEYWTSYDDDSVDLCRLGSEKCPWKNVDDPKPKNWGNRACNDPDHLTRRRRNPILKDTQCGDLRGDYGAHAFYARRRVIDRVIPHPFVMAVPMPFYNTIDNPARGPTQQCVNKMISRRRWSTNSCECRRRNSPNDLPKGWACNGNRIAFTGDNLGTEQLMLFPKRFPNLFSVVGDDDAGSCEIRNYGVCIKRNTQVKSLHTLFFFGFPLRNVNPAWTGLTGDKGRNEASDYLMEWIFNTFNDMLVQENKNAKGFKMSFDANSLQNGSPLLKQYIAYNIPRDAVWITGAILFMLTYISFTTGSLFLGVCIIAMIVFAFGPALLLYTLVFQQRYIGLLHLNGLFIILGVGVDDAFVIMDAYGQEKAEAEADGRPTNFSALMSPAVHHASKACLCTSLTTFFAFFSNATSDFPSIRTFGLFCACLIITNFIIDFSFFLAIVCANERLQRKPTPAASPSGAAPSSEADSLRPMEKWFHDTFFTFVKMTKFPLLIIFACLAAACMWTASYVTPDPNMPKVFLSSDNYERFLPTLAKRYERTFNPFRLKVRIHVGIDAEDPIDRGTTPDYNDCFFNCAGQKPKYLDIFATASEKSPVRTSRQWRMQKILSNLCDTLEDAAEAGAEGDLAALRIASEQDLGGMPPLKCVFEDFEQWINMQNAAARQTSAQEGKKAYPSSNFCCDKDSDFVQFLEAPMPPKNKMYQSGQRNMEHFQNEVFFDRVDGELVLRSVVIEIALKTTWQIPYKDGIKLNEHWDEFVATFAAKQAKKESLPDLPKAIFATDMFAFHWFFVQEAMNGEVFDGIKLSLFLAFLVLVFATGNIVVAGISVSCIVAIVSSVLAFAVCMDWKTSVSEAIIYVMVIGLSVDYVIHLGDAYLECPDESNEDRVQFMVTKMGVSVVSGAVSSAGAAVFMMFCKSLFLIKFGIVICFVISVSVVTSLVFFSALLLVAGPSGQCGSITPMLVKLGIKKSDKPSPENEAGGEEPAAEKVQPRLYSSVVRYRKSLARASMAQEDARTLALQLAGGDAELQTNVEIEMSAVKAEPKAKSGPRASASDASGKDASRQDDESDGEVMDLRDLRDS
ncbi:unnamed protein product [Effrenium voratum]|uniref:SSD domain-containing protein n=1 Tax=Effrenium voratum TaxID=2562239 RepID=A0AA36MZG7_9DINO|nr:unnamed protein product [Effrenium voratum]